MNLTAIFQWAKSILKEVFELSWALFKVMIPVLLVVKILEELGGIELLTLLVAPAMSWVGLPHEMGLVLATTMLTNIYGGMVIFFSVAPEVPLTVAQVTVLGIMMLMAHALPIEVRISQKAGVRPIYLLLLRVISAFSTGWMLNKVYSSNGLLQHQNDLFWQPQLVDPGWIGWALGQVKSLLMITLIILALVILLRLFKLVGIEKLFVWLLQPVMRLLGMSKQATTIVIVGMTLGLSFGAGLLIREAHSGKVSAKDLFSALTLLALCHSIIEDTLLILLLGADISGVLWGRLLFSIILVICLSRLYNSLSDGFQRRYLILTRSST